MNVQVVTLTYDVKPSAALIDEWTGIFEAEGDGSVAYIPGRGVTVTVWVEGYDVVKAPAVATSLVDVIVGAEPIGVEVLSEAEYLRRADEPSLPELVSAPEVADLLGVSRQRVHQLRDLGGFPAPVYELRTGPIWDARAIEHFATTWERRPGRPRVGAGQAAL